MAWIVEYADTAKKQIRKLDKTIARRILNFMDKRVALSDDPRQTGKALNGPLGDLWRYRVGDILEFFAIFRTARLTVLVLEIGDRKEVYR